MLRRTLLLLMIALPSVACMKKSAGTMDVYDYGGGAAEEAPTADDDADYGATYDGVDAGSTMTATAEPVPMDAPPPERESKRGGGLFARRDRRMAKSQAESPAAVQPAEGATQPATTPAAKAEPAVAEDEPPDLGRHIIYTASMHVSVFNLVDAMAAAEALPEKFGGYIANMNEGMIVLRIPSKNLRALMDEAGELGVVEHRTLQAQDVTDEFFDIESRIKALEKTHVQLLELLGKARTVQEALEVRRALDQIAMELEVLKGRMRKLENLISYSTITLTLVERGPFTPTPSSNDPFPWVDTLGVEATEWK